MNKGYFHPCYPSKGLSLYPSELKSWEFGKEAAQIFVSGASDHCLNGKALSEDQKFAAKLTKAKNQLLSSLGYTCMRRLSSFTAFAILSGRADLPECYSDAGCPHLTG